MSCLFYQNLGNCKLETNSIVSLFQTLPLCGDKELNLRKESARLLSQLSQLSFEELGGREPMLNTLAANNTCLAGNNACLDEASVHCCAQSVLTK
jgi:hypothetical protein